MADSALHSGPGGATGRWRNAKALRAPNVVCLPTAAPRQVQQHYNRAASAARRAAREQQGVKFPHRCPVDRVADKRAAVLVDVKPTPALILVQAILAELDQETRLKIIGQLAAHGAQSTPSRQAFEIASATMLNFGDQWALFNALDRTRGKD